jgi:hypothetical protein
MFILFDRNYGISFTLIKKKQTPWSESASELYQPSDRRLWAKWLPTCADKGCHVVSVTDPYGRILGFLDINTNINTYLWISDIDFGQKNIRGSSRNHISSQLDKSYQE